MSSYEDYGQASARYDETRVAVGAEIVLGALASGAVPLAEVELLDAGCGTGSYAEAVAGCVGALTLLDASEEMLAVARRKLGTGPGLAYRQGRLQDLPFDDSSFDAVMTNQVLHHLGDEGDEGDEGDGHWRQHARVFSEYRRVLRPGGVLVVNTCSRHQLRHGYWYYALIPEAAERLRRRYAPLPVLDRQAAANGLTVTGRFVPVAAALQGMAYLDGSGPLSASWRSGDSVWSLVEDDELAAMRSTVSHLDERGALDGFVTEHDARRQEIGQITFVVARALSRG